MKILFLLLFASVTFGQSIPEKVGKFADSKKLYSVDYDKFQKQHKIETEIVVPYAKKQSGWIQSVGQKVTVWMTIPDVGDPFIFFSFSKDRGYYNQPTLRFLADGELVEVSSDDIDDIVSFDISPKQLRKLADAKVLEMQLVSFEGKFSEKGLQQLRNIASLIP